MKAFDQLISLLLSPTFPTVDASDFAILNQFLQEKSIADVLILFEQQSAAMLAIPAERHHRIGVFLKHALKLETLLLLVMKEMSDIFHIINAYKKNITKNSSEKKKPEVKALEFNAESFTDMSVIYLASQKLDDLKKIASTLDSVSNIATGFFASNITNFYVACKYCVDNTVDQSLFFNTNYLAARNWIDLKETILLPLKQHLEQNHHVHFSKIIEELRSVYQKAPEFYFELTNQKSVSDIVKQINLEFKNKTSPYNGNPVLTGHLEKCVIIQKALQLLSAPSADLEHNVNTCIEYLNENKTVLYKKITATNDSWFPFYSTPLLEDEKSLNAIFKLIDDYLEKIRLDKINKMQ